jgi:hypothetical protein
VSLEARCSKLQAGESEHADKASLCGGPAAREVWRRCVLKMTTGQEAGPLAVTVLVA